MTDEIQNQNEQDRLEALRRLSILDTPREEPFQCVVRLAAHLLEAQIALVSLVDEERQWFKAAHCMGKSETPRDWSFCALAIRSEGVMVVPDATRDPRFRDNPMVTTDPNIRFYAGAPLFVERGLAIGTLCVIDRCPRERLSPVHEQCLLDLARITAELIKARVGA